MKVWPAKLNLILISEKCAVLLRLNNKHIKQLPHSFQIDGKMGLP